MALDLGGIAKGYTLNRLAEVIAKSGVSSALVNIGGDILAVGEKTGRQSMACGSERSSKSSRHRRCGSPQRPVIVTSGDYERLFIIDGKRYHHILDPRTG